MTSKASFVQAIKNLFTGSEPAEQLNSPADIQLMSARLQKLKQTLENPRAKRANGRQQFFGASRRAVDLMPANLSHSPAETIQTSQVRFHQLLINIEGSQVTGCFKVISATAKSRSSLLLYRGRALGCVFGERLLDQQLFGEEALACLLEDLSCPENSLVAHQLPEDIVLAASSLFQGQGINLGRLESSQHYFQTAMDHLQETRMPGTVVIKRKNDEATSIIYVARGKVVGIYSNRDGWQDHNSIKSFFDLSGTDEVEIAASMLNAQTGEQAYLLGMSLTGLHERRLGFGKATDSLKAKISARQRRWHAHKEGKHSILQSPALQSAPETIDQTYYNGFHATTVARSVKHAHLIKP